MFITRDFDIFFLVCNGYLVIRVVQPWHVTLKIVMNTNIHMILGTLPFSFGMAKGILKAFIWKSKVLLSRRRRIIPNKESLRERMREQAQGQVTRLWSSRTLENEYKHYLR